jgi:predicted RNase H-like HicB family nuclease
MEYDFNYGVKLRKHFGIYIVIIPDIDNSRSFGSGETEENAIKDAKYALLNYLDDMFYGNINNIPTPKYKSKIKIGLTTEEVFNYCEPSVYVRNNLFYDFDTIDFELFNKAEDYKINYLEALKIGIETLINEKESNKQDTEDK